LSRRYKEFKEGTAISKRIKKGTIVHTFSKGWLSKKLKENSKEKKK